MNILKNGLTISLITLCSLAQARPAKFTDLVKYVQQAPDQGKTNTCWFVASTGVMELLLNKKNNVTKPKRYGPYDLSESFVIWQNDFWDKNDPQEHFVEEVVARFNHGEAVLNKNWPFEGWNNDGSINWNVWNKHKKFYDLPRIQVPPVKSELLFARGKKWATHVLEDGDIEAMKEAMSSRQAPLIVNYNDDGFWHVVVIVGYDDNKQGVCYEIEKEDCNKGSFIVRDSDGLKHQYRATNWFLQKGNAAAVVELK